MYVSSSRNKVRNICKFKSASSTSSNPTKNSLNYIDYQSSRLEIQTFAPAFPRAPVEPVRPTFPCLWQQQNKQIKKQANKQTNKQRIKVTHRWIVIIYEQDVVFIVGVFRTALVCFLLRSLRSFYLTLTYKQTAMNELSHPHPGNPCGSGWPCESSYTLNKERKDVVFSLFFFFSTCKFLIDFEG